MRPIPVTCHGLKLAPLNDAPSSQFWKFRIDEPEGWTIANFRAMIAAVAQSHVLCADYRPGETSMNKRMVVSVLAAAALTLPGVAGAAACKDANGRLEKPLERSGLI